MKCTCKYRSLNLCDGCKNAQVVRKFMGLVVLPAIVVSIVTFLVL